MKTKTGAAFWRDMWEMSFQWAQRYRINAMTAVERGTRFEVIDNKILARAAIRECRKRRGYEAEAKRLLTAAPRFDPFRHGPAILTGGCLRLDFADEPSRESLMEPPWLEDMHDDDRREYLRPSHAI